MPLSIASWNIEKNGESSEMAKKAKVEEFIHQCCWFKEVSIVFLCETHSKQIQNYVTHLSQLYEKYDVYWRPGGYSNAYVIMVHKKVKIEISHDTLERLNRSAVLIRYGNLSLLFAHFKSGQTRLTKSQLEHAAEFLQGISPNRWAILGDMNWDFLNVGKLALSFQGYGYTCWDDKTQAKGGILDWCLAGENTQVEVWDLTHEFSSVIYDMKGPDHKPVVFNIG